MYRAQSIEHGVTQSIHSVRSTSTANEGWGTNHLHTLSDPGIPTSR
jgi:hypothetical protein